MPGWSDFGNIWNTFKEIDIRPIAEEAERPMALAFVGAPGVGKSTLIAALRYNVRAREKIISPTIESDLTNAAQLEADLIVLMVDAQRRDVDAEATLCRAWKEAGRTVLIFYNKMDAIPNGNAIGATIGSWCDAKIAYGSAIDPDSLAADFVPRVLDLVRDRHLALARRYSIFRLAVARALISDTSSASATYALSTGLAEIVPALNIPFNVADIVILTKNQALMVYKLGLALGLSTRWQEHVAEFGGVIGAGFLWRQVARQLIGLIPGWGIVPKVAIAYAGTFAVGEAILRWYQTGRKLSAQGMKQVYSEALARGKQVAQDLIARAPKPALPKVSMPAPRLALPKDLRTSCASCGKSNPRDARFCAYCGTSL
jgi:uncharacterized protein (DUF697 family)